MQKAIGCSKGLEYPWAQNGLREMSSKNESALLNRKCILKKTGVKLSLSSADKSRSIHSDNQLFGLQSKFGETTQNLP